MTKYVLRAKKINYNRYGVLIPTKEEVVLKLQDRFRAMGKTEFFLIDMFKKDENVEFKIIEDKVSQNSVAKEAIKEETRTLTETDIKETLETVPEPKKPGRKKKD